MARPRSSIAPRIVRAARKRFLAEGVDGASLRQIAKGAGTSIGMIYYYHPTKDDLFLAVVEETYQVVLADLEAVLDPSLPVEVRIRGLYQRVGQVTDAELQVIRLVLREALVSSTRLERIIDRFQRGHLPLLLRLVADALAGGTFDPALHPAAALISMMALGGPGQLVGRMMAARLPFGAPLAGAALGDQLVSILLHGVGAKAPAGVHP